MIFTLFNDIVKKDFEGYKTEAVLPKNMVENCQQKWLKRFAWPEVNPNTLEKMGSKASAEYSEY